MALFDFKKAMNEAAQTMKNNLDSVQSAAKNIQLEGTVQNAKEKGKEAFSLLRKKADAARTVITDVVTKKEEVHGFITAAGAMQLIYLVMAADSRIEDEELAQFQEIGKELDSRFPEYSNNLLSECHSMMARVDEEDFHDDLHDLAKSIVEKTLNVQGAQIPVKLLVWNLLVISFSDGDMAEDELGLLRYIAKHLQVDKSIVPEMEHSIRALNAVEAEISWLKSTRRSYTEVENVLNELSDRKLTIMQSVRDLINE